MIPNIGTVSIRNAIRSDQDTSRAMAAGFTTAQWATQLQHVGAWLDVHPPRLINVDRVDLAWQLLLIHGRVVTPDEAGLPIAEVEMAWHGGYGRVDAASLAIRGWTWVRAMRPVSRIEMRRIRANYRRRQLARRRRDR